MKEENVVKEKSYKFALRIVKLHRFLIEERKEFILSKQLVRAGTSIGANVEEAVGGVSKNDFAAKIGIAYKEARECHYWIRLLRDSEYLVAKEAASILADCEELLKLITSILLTTKNLRKPNEPMQ